MRVWTGTVCRAGDNVVGHITYGATRGDFTALWRTVTGSKQHPARCSEAKERNRVRCCAEMAMPPPSPPLVVPGAPYGLSLTEASCTALSVRWTGPPVWPPSGSTNFTLAWSRGDCRRNPEWASPVPLDREGPRGAARSGARDDLHSVGRCPKRARARAVERPAAAGHPPANPIARAARCARCGRHPQQLHLPEGEAAGLAHGQLRRRHRPRTPSDELDGLGLDDTAADDGG